MNRLLNIGIIFAVSGHCYAYSFMDAIKVIESHDSIKSLEYESKSLAQEARLKGSWGDPSLSISAMKNPRNKMNDDYSERPAIEFGLSQKISLTRKYGNIKESFELMGKARSFESNDRKNELIKNFWLIIINKKQLKEEIGIIKEEIEWIRKMLKISKRLYANGKISQQALLDIEIRKSELESLYSNNLFDQEITNDKLSYLLGIGEQSLDEKTIPWSLLNKKMSDHIDNRELSLESLTESKDKMLMAQKLDYIPDVTFSLNYMKNSNSDENGDFVSAMVSFPIPVSSSKYASHSKASLDKYSALKKLENYKRYKKSERGQIEKLAKKTQAELKILQDKTIKFAENSRKVASKSYSQGNASYVELLQSELNLQKLLLKKVNATAKLLEYKVDLKYLVGEKLYE